MMIEFNSIDELYKRVLPALKSKKDEFFNNGYFIECSDIWDFLVSSRWISGKDLTLFDIVSDIFNVSYDEILSFKKNCE